MTDAPRTVDALGTHCPVPLQLLGAAMRRRPDSDVFALLADDPLIAVDLPAWCHRHGHQLVDLHERDGEWQGTVRRAGSI